jgi:hypothetical protein
MIEGHWVTRSEPLQEVLSWFGDESNDLLQNFISEVWNSDIFSNILRIRELNQLMKIRQNLKVSEDDWRGYILSFQVNESLNITLFKGDRCLHGIKAQNQQIDLIARISCFLENIRHQLSKKETIPTKKQVEMISEIIRNACFATWRDQTVLRDWTPISMIPARDLWAERHAIMREAEADLQGNVSLNMIGLEMEHYDWQEWDNSKHLQTLQNFHEIVNFFMPMRYLRLGHSNVNFRGNGWRRTGVRRFRRLQSNSLKRVLQSRSAI